MVFKRTKANLRALREIVGYSQQDIADLCGVRVEAVKHWERENSIREIPDDVWVMITNAYEAHVGAVDTALEIIEEQLDKNPNINKITIPYWRNQGQYDKLGRDPGSFKLVNARSRSVAAVLEDMGIPYEFISPEDRGPEAQNDKWCV